MIQYRYSHGGQRVAMRVEGETDPARNGLFYLLSDHLGSTTVTLKDTGSLSKVGELRYKPWGANRASGYAETLTPTGKRFTGQRWESGIGLYHYGARWYDPATGRFTQPDTIVPDPGNPQAWDRYAYVLNNPTRYTDPTGHKEEGACDPWDSVCNRQVERDLLTRSVSEKYDPPKPPLDEKDQWAKNGRK